MALNKEIKEQLIKDFGHNAQDSGSSKVQVAMLSERIKELTEHMKKNKKDFSSKRGLLKMLSRRRLFLKYIERTDKAQYLELLKRLSLKR